MTEKRNNKILFVDDEKSILNSIRRLLRKEQYELSFCEFPKEALEKIKAEEFAVIVSDHRMPELEGVDLLEKVQEVAPDTIRILLTGYADKEAAIAAINRGSVYQFLTKPWKDQELIVHIRQAVDQYNLAIENKELQELTKKQNAELLALNQSLEEKVEQRTAKITALNQEIKRSFLGTVKIMAGISEFHNPSIGTHCKRVGQLCMKLAKTMGIEGEELFQIEVAAYLHDIGKVALDSEVLQKPKDKLGIQDEEELKKHVEIGREIVQMVPGFEEVATIIYHHHEHFDGSGYPKRLAKEKIPLGARIVSVVNAFDNFLQEREEYCDANVQEALEHLQEQSTILFDPTVVEALADCLEKNIDPEMEIAAPDLKSGMRLSKDLKTPLGALLLAKNTVVTKKHLKSLENHLLQYFALEGIYVYRSLPKKEQEAA